MYRRHVCLLLALIAALAVVSCVAQKETASDLDRLEAWMTGSFSSQKQAEADSEYFEVRLEMVPIWPNRDDGPWLYVEQATAEAVQTPYRQRIYHLTQPDDTTIVSVIYELASPIRLAGAWRVPASLDFLTPDSLTEIPGCAVVLRAEGDSLFVGSTVDRECLTDFRGATYTTSEVTIRATGISTWDRGWDSTGTQVWGAEEGAYRFEKIVRE